MFFLIMKRVLVSFILTVYPVSFITKRCTDLTDKDFELCSRLFSNHYGYYNGGAPSPKAGKRIRMSGRMFRSFYQGRNNAFVAMAFVRDRLIGHAFYISEDVGGRGRCTWVTQLVVHRAFRKRTIAARLLQSAWGFSDDLAWGLATVNPMTIKVLERATFRKVELDHIRQEINLIRLFQKDIPFAADKRIVVDSQSSSIASDFYPFNENEHTAEFRHYRSILGDIPNGGEWIAFVFNSQKLVINQKNWESFMKFQEAQLIDSYSRMNMPTHKWTAGTQDEVSFVLDCLERMNAPVTSKTSILDIGCGTGRHLNSLLAKQPVGRAVGIDFSTANIERARSGARGIPGDVKYLVKDARHFRSTRQFDVILCLYDVIGSFRDNKDNERILAAVHSNLKKGGYAFISVMNMEYTEHVAKHKESLSRNPESLLLLKPSEKMAKTGDVFDPDLFIINTDDGLVYRKEQFKDRIGRDAEYVIADKRYTLREMRDILERKKFHVVESKYVRANHWRGVYESNEAKEILFVVRKG